LVVMSTFTNGTVSGATRAVFTLALVAVTVATLTGTAAHAQTVPVTAGTAASIARDESASAPEAEIGASPWYLKGRFLVGATWGAVATIDKNLGTQHKVSPFFRWNSRRRGWGPSFGLSFTRTDLRAPVDGKATEIGSVTIRPVMAGIGYSVVKGRSRATFGLVGGYSFNDASVDRALPDGVGVDVTIENAWVVKPKVDLMFAATRRLALIASFGYTIANPDVSVTVTQNGQDAFRARDHVRVDSFSVRLGGAVSLF
jgi:hypothetical protein